MTDEQSLGWNNQIHSDRGKSLKFAEVAQIHKFCESRNARKKIGISKVYYILCQSVWIIQAVVSCTCRTSIRQYWVDDQLPDDQHIVI